MVLLLIAYIGNCVFSFQFVYSFISFIKFFQRISQWFPWFSFVVFLFSVSLIFNLYSFLLFFFLKKNKITKGPWPSGLEPWQVTAASPGLTGEGLPSGWDFLHRKWEARAGRPNPQQNQLRLRARHLLQPLPPATTQEVRGPTCVLQGLKNSECLCPGAVCSLEREAGP